MGGKQLGFGDYEQTTARKRTKRERFLAQMEAVVPWKALVDLIEPHYPKAGSKGEVGAFYWTVPAPDIVNSGREEQGLVSV